MRKHFRRWLPSHEAMQRNRWLSRFAHLQHPNLWHLNRHSVAAGVGIGLFAGLLPPPFQMLSAALIAIAVHGNLPVAVLTTLYTNPLTFGPLYVLAYFVGKTITGENGGLVAPPDFAWSNIGPWMEALWQWTVSLGKPLVIGVVTLSVLFGALGWVTVHLGWRVYVRTAWKRRCARRRAASRS